MSFIAYHLSPEPSIRKFDLKHVGQGLGTGFYGAGLYLTCNLDVVDYYAKQIVERPLTIYTVEIPEEGIFDEFDILPATNKTALGTYADLVESFQDELKATKEIIKLGVKGIKYNSPEDGEAFVIYEPKNLKILNRKEI